MKPALLLNGPPWSGKDTLAQILGEKLAEKNIRALIASLATIPKQRVADEYNVSPTIMFSREHKDMDFKNFGRSSRQILIDYSENIKKMYGQDFWAKELIRMSKQDMEICDLLIVTDVGFQVEVDCLSKVFDTTVVQLEREGMTYVNDSREPVFAKKLITIVNSGTISELEGKINELAENMASSIEI